MQERDDALDQVKALKLENESLDEQLEHAMRKVRDLQADVLENEGDYGNYRMFNVKERGPGCLCRRWCRGNVGWQLHFSNARLFLFTEELERVKSTNSLLTSQIQKLREQKNAAGPMEGANEDHALAAECMQLRSQLAGASASQKRMRLWIFQLILCEELAQ